MIKIDLSIDKTNPEKSFNRIANELMNNWILVSGISQYRICEIEFYLRTIEKEDNWHDDPYVHGHPLQKTSHRWYFHGSGIDLTFGCETFYGGILLRAIQNIDIEKEYHYGPLVLLSELFGQFPTIEDTNLTFGLIPYSGNGFEKETPIAAPRVGLNKKHDRNGMRDSLYRFLVLPKKKHADKTRIAEAMKASGDYTLDEINNIWG